MGDLKVGDIVKLKSSSPNMTITGTVDGFSRVKCSWFKDSISYSDNFHVDSLIISEITSTNTTNNIEKMETAFNKMEHDTIVREKGK